LIVIARRRSDEAISRRAERYSCTPDVAARVGNEGGEIVASRPDEFAARIRQDTGKWAKIIRAAGIQQ
jgi:tripartite-type tricarboxylate transporter receptor subunit TctC